MERLSAATKKAQTADEAIDVSIDVTGYQQAVDNLSACISAYESVDNALFSESAGVAVVARELERKMKTRLRQTIKKVEQMLCGAMFTAETTCEWVPLASYLEKLFADKVLRQSCADAIESAKDVLATLQAEAKQRKAEVSVHVC